MALDKVYVHKNNKTLSVRHECFCLIYLFIYLFYDQIRSIQPFAKRGILKIAPEPNYLPTPVLTNNLCLDCTDAVHSLQLNCQPVSNRKSEYLQIFAEPNKHEHRNFSFHLN